MTMECSRRDFLKASSLIATAMGLQATGIFKFDEALALEAANGGVPVIWLQGQACTGCSVSLLNSIYLMTAAELLTTALDLDYHSTVMAAAGSTAMAAAEEAYRKGGYVLILEGAIPTANNGTYAYVWPGMTIQRAIARYTQRAAYIIGVGTCASYGGMAAGAPNPTGATGLAASYNGKTVIKIPGCPIHPDWLVGTVASLLAGTVPALDSNGRPTAYYGHSVHRQCPLDPANGTTESRALGIGGCQYQLGCRGPWTMADCPSRRWNSAAKGVAGATFCTTSGGPCTGCTEPNFPDGMSPFYKYTTGPSPELP